MTIKDIAKLSGYSVGTVSRVLNSHPDVSDEARRHVMDVITANHFQPNTNAKHLKQQNSSAIAILVKGTQNMLFADILERIQPQLVAADEKAVVCYLDEDANEVAYALQLFREQRPRGLIFLGGNLEFFQESFHRLTTPSVLLTNTAEKLNIANLSSFTTDDTQAAATAIDYLLQQGHRKIGLLGGNLSFTQISYHRIQGSKCCLQQHHIPFDDNTQYESCRFSMADGYAATKRLLQKSPDLTAIFVVSDMIAFGAMRAIFDLGLQVPKDISLIGYDGISISQYCIPRLTTIRQDTQTLAKKAVSDLLQRIHYPTPAIHELIPFQLIPGESVRQLAP